MDELRRHLGGGFSDPRTLGRELLARGWLTAFQVNQVGRGRLPALGPYSLLGRLGRGSMGTVFLARHRLMRRPVALKLLHRQDLADRFLREVEAVARLDHPNVVHAYDADIAGGRPYLVMEYVEGSCLQRLVERGGPLPAALACDYARQAALGLQHASDRGVVHRDVKPSNLLLRGRDGRVMVSDFGLARLEGAGGGGPGLTREGVVLGTLDFISPEQAAGASSADARSDLYSLGCTLYYLLSGRPPFSGGSAVEKLLRHGTETPAPLVGVPPGVEAVVGRLMAKRPQDRYQSPAEAAEALGRVEAAGATPPHALAGRRRATATRPGFGRGPLDVQHRLVPEPLPDVPGRLHPVVPRRPYQDGLHSRLRHPLLDPLERHRMCIPTIRRGSSRSPTAGRIFMPTTHTAEAVAQRRVLIVEDNHDNRETLRILLGIWNFAVEVAEDGPDGLRKALAWAPDIAIVDIGLPGFDGYEFARRVREALGTRVVLIAVTGYGGPENRKLALDAGFDEHMTKGTDLSEILGRLRAV